MDILIPHSWLREFLKTDATPSRLSECLSLCGPSVEKIEKGKHGTVYHIEVTTNRPDSISVHGIAREASAILPRFGIQTKFQEAKLKSNQKLTKKVNYLSVQVDHKLCPRFSAILIKDIKIKDSSPFIQERLGAVGVRPINNVVDVTNYVMHELGQPMHVFDYDKIAGSKMVLRAAKKGESVTTLDNKTHKLPGGDIVIEDGSGKLIDLAGVMGGKNSAIDKNTKNILLFVQTYDPATIRRTTMRLSARSEASSVFEKGLDPENVEIAMRRAIDLLTAEADGKPGTNILDLYPSPYKKRFVKTTIQFIEERMGVKISKVEISKTLTSLGFGPVWGGNSLTVTIPSWRADDINIPEDIIEEVARIYGYFNLPSELMASALPTYPANDIFSFEKKLKTLLVGWGGTEIYTLSMLAGSMLAGSMTSKPNGAALRLKNPLGPETEYLRTSLVSSLVMAASQNPGQSQFHLFEMSNVYIPRTGDLPNEKMMLAGIFVGFTWRSSKGILEALLEKLNINPDIAQKDKDGFRKSRRIIFSKYKTELGSTGVLENNMIYWEFDVKILQDLHKGIGTFKAIPKYPPQVEDISLIIPPRTYLADVISAMYKTDKRLVSVDLSDTYKNIRTFGIAYQDINKTLTDQEVKKIRNQMLNRLRTTLGVKIKE